MGLDRNNRRFLEFAKNQWGVDFSETATLGHQEFHEPVIDVGMKYADDYLHFVLGAQRVASFDASDYEGATYIHDFNKPINLEQYGRFTAVIDAGSLEHIFNFPQAISNCMDMVAEGGHLLIMTPANNLCGHGFYQFSPELFYRVLSQWNGFKIQDMFSAELPEANWNTIPDPEVVGYRVGVQSSKPTVLLVLAKKLVSVPLSLNHLQQSDYAVAWRT